MQQQGCCFRACHGTTKKQEKAKIRKIIFQCFLEKGFSVGHADRHRSFCPCPRLSLSRLSLSSFVFVLVCPCPRCPCPVTLTSSSSVRRPSISRVAHGGRNSSLIQLRASVEQLHQQLYVTHEMVLEEDTPNAQVEVWMGHVKTTLSSLTVVRPNDIAIRNKPGELHIHF